MAKYLLQVGDVFILRAGAATRNLGINENTAGEYVVHQVTSDGGGTGHGLHDVYPNGHHVHAERLLTPGVKVHFFQTGCFSGLITDLQVVGHAARRWEVTYLPKEPNAATKSVINLAQHLLVEEGHWDEECSAGYVYDAVTRICRLEDKWATECDRDVAYAELERRNNVRRVKRGG